MVAKFKWDSKSPKPIEVSVVAVRPPSAGGMLKFMVLLTLAIHKYGETSKVQPGTSADGCPRLAGCCARAGYSSIAIMTASPEDTVNIESSLASICIGPE
jgi:hypothetical protein